MLNLASIFEAKVYFTLKFCHYGQNFTEDNSRILCFLTASNAIKDQLKFIYKIQKLIKYLTKTTRSQTAIDLYINRKDSPEKTFNLNKNYYTVTNKKMFHSSLCRRFKDSVIWNQDLGWFAGMSPKEQNPPVVWDLITVPRIIQNQCHQWSTLHMRRTLRLKNSYSSNLSIKFIVFS